VALSVIRGIADRLEQKENRIETLIIENELLRGQRDTFENRLRTLEIGPVARVGR
jgi:hypothetical protein